MTITNLIERTTSDVRVPQWVHANLPFVTIIAVYVAAAMAVAISYDFHLNFRIYSALTAIFAPAVAVLWLAGAALFAVLRHRPDRPFLFLWHAMTVDWQIGRRMAYGVPVLITMTFFMSAFTSMKSAIPVIMPFYADPWAAELDRAIHGRDAWEVLQPLLGFPVVTVTVNFFYNMWFLVINTALIGAAFMLKNDALRSQFLTAFVLCWALLGTLAATLLSSVGPCYYALFYGGEPFAPLLVYLQEANLHYPIWALTAQNFLYESFQASESGLGRGISALPSLHVSIATLIALFARKIHRVLGGLALAFLILIIVGSIHLGWHYAVDAYASLIATPLIWWVSGKALRRERNDTSHERR